jgi:hypothetical protein
MATGAHTPESLDGASGVRETRVNSGRRDFVGLRIQTADAIVTLITDRIGCGAVPLLPRRLEVFLFFTVNRTC